MPTVRVPLNERSYDISIERDILKNFRQWAPEGEIAVLTNRTIGPLLVDELAAGLEAAGRRVVTVHAPDGEAYKSLEWTSRAYDELAAFGLTRRGTIIAIGGGVVGDWAGFVAATWMRGIDFIQVPTTLLSMVDSSVGGKTGVNHPRAKNLIGAFHQPVRVIIDPETLRTLPPRELRAGLAEVIKYGVIADPDFFAWLEANIERALELDMDALQYIIQRSVEIKAEVVGEDERESDTSGRRATLNYGHTIGHAIEATTEYGRYLHGEAISIGMTAAAHLARQLGVIEDAAGTELIERQTRLFERAGLPVAMDPENDFETWSENLWAAMLLDKKSRAGAVNFLLPNRLGEVVRVPDVSAEAVRGALREIVAVPAQ